MFLSETVLIGTRAFSTVSYLSHGFGEFLLLWVSEKLDTIDGIPFLS
jgi:hypothetical protein